MQLWKGWVTQVENKIRILHVAQAAGGVDRYIRMLLKYMDKDMFEHVLVCSFDFREADYKEQVIAFEQIPMYRSIGVKDLTAVGTVRGLIRKYRPDIVYAHSSKAGAIARIADIGLRNLCIYNPHGWAFNMRSSRSGAIYIAIERMAAPFCEKIVCISDAEKKSALGRNICGENKLRVIFNGADIEAYESRPREKARRGDLNIPEDAFVIGMVGRISCQKAPDVFIKAAKLIKRDIPNAYFMIVGSGPQEREIRDYARKNGLAQSLLITGWVDNPMRYIEPFDIAMLLSRWEGFGLVLPEYMMAGKPIVATRVDAIPNIIENRRNGLLVEVDDVEGVYRAVMELYENEELRRRFADVELKVVHERFNARRVATEHEILFREMKIYKLTRFYEHRLSVIRGKEMSMDPLNDKGMNEIRRVNLYRCQDEIVNDAYDRAVVNIYLQKEKKGYKSFLLCGSEAGVGTTSICVELAISLAVSGWKTVLVDGDMRKERWYKRLNQEAEEGLADYISAQVELENCTYHTNWNGLFYIPCGISKIESPVRMLCSVNMDKAMRKLQDEYDFIIVDAPSMNSAADAQILTVKTDATILVTALHSAKTKCLEDAKKQLVQSGGNLIGVIENKVGMDEYKKYIKDYDYFKQKKYAGVPNRGN